MTEHKYIIHGRPIACQRPRFSLKPGVSQGHIWDSQKKEKFAYGLILKQLHNNKPFFQGAIEVELKFSFVWPAKSKYIYERPHIFKPDLDNLIKLYLDVANGILWKDDCAVSKITACKFYGVDEKTEIIVRVYE